MGNTYREIFEEEDTELLLHLCNKQIKVHERALSKRQHESDVSEMNRVQTQQAKKRHLESVIDKLVDESL